MLSQTSQANILALKESYQKLWWPIRWLFFPRQLGVALDAIRGSQITEAQALAVCMAFPKHIWFFQHWVTTGLRTFLSSPLGYTVNALNQTKVDQTAHKSAILASILLNIDRGLGNAINRLNTHALLDGEYALDYFSAIVKNESPPCAADFLVSLKPYGVMESATEVHVYCQLLEQKQAFYFHAFDKALSILAAAQLLHSPDAPSLVATLLSIPGDQAEIANIIVRIQQILARTQHPKALLEYVQLLKNHPRRSGLHKALDYLSDWFANEDVLPMLETLLHDKGNPVYCANALIALDQAKLISGPDSAEYLTILLNRNSADETSTTCDVNVLHQHDLLNLGNLQFVLSFDSHNRSNATHVLTCLKDLHLIDDGDTATYRDFLNTSNVRSDTPTIIRSLDLPSKLTAPVIIKAAIKNHYHSSLVSKLFNQLHAMHVLDDTNTTQYADVLENCHFSCWTINYSELVTELHTKGFLQGVFSVDHLRFVLTLQDPKRAIEILDTLKSAHMDLNNSDVQIAYAQVLEQHWDTEELIGISRLKENHVLTPEHFIRIMSTPFVRKTVDQIVIDHTTHNEVKSVLDNMKTTIERFFDPRLFAQSTKEEQEEALNNKDEIALNGEDTDASLFSMYQQLGA